MTVALATSSDLPDLDADDRPLLGALEAIGIAARPVVWSDPEVDWSSFDLVVVRSTWDYTNGKRDAYLAWADGVAAETRLANGADVLRWNTHKGYLMELEERGVPTVPTAFLGAGDRVDLGELIADRHWGDVVVKPCVSAGARDTFLVRSDEVVQAQARFAELVARTDVMVQPFLPAVATTGEASIIHLGGSYSHAARKVPASGEWRVQEEFGGANRPWDPPTEVRDLAAWIIDATGHDYLYARVDLLPDEDGVWQLTELEVTEPSLYLTVVDGAAERFAKAIADVLAGRVHPSDLPERT